MTTTGLSVQLVGDSILHLNEPTVERYIHMSGITEVTYVHTDNVAYLRIGDDDVIPFDGHLFEQVLALWLKFVNFEE